MQLCALDAADKAAQDAKANVDDSIRPLCVALAGKVNAFLDAEVETEMLRRVQDQTRAALGVITAALEKYR